MTWRLFLAINIPSHIRHWLKVRQSDLQLIRGLRTKWVDLENLHLTLSYFGEVSVDSVEKLAGDIQSVIENTPGFRLGFKGLGSFPANRSPRVLWVGLDGDRDILDHMQRDLTAVLSIHNWLQDTKPFQPHVTLGRVKQIEDNFQKEELLQLQTINREIVSESWQVKSVELMRSQLTREGPIYSVVKAFSLKLDKG